MFVPRAEGRQMAGSLACIGAEGILGKGADHAAGGFAPGHREPETVYLGSNSSLKVNIQRATIAVLIPEAGGSNPPPAITTPPIIAIAGVF